MRGKIGAKCRARRGSVGRDQAFTLGTDTLITLPISLFSPLFTLPSLNSSSTPRMVDLELIGPISMPPGSSPVFFSTMTMASIGGFLMGSSVLPCPTGPITSTGLKIS
uniref:Uncharacterized protein n=1 Tax=Opuntia streptacantha TaxID=393608 RepID=A0A7C9FG53_OPUST